jgi:hypothetical protein
MMFSNPVISVEKRPLSTEGDANRRKELADRRKPERRDEEPDAAWS